VQTNERLEAGNSLCETPARVTEHRPSCRRLICAAWFTSLLIGCAREIATPAIVFQDHDTMKVGRLFPIRTTTGGLLVLDDRTSALLFQLAEHVVAVKPEANDLVVLRIHGAIQPNQGRRCNDGTVRRANHPPRRGRWRKWFRHASTLTHE
jgi:hypothetical protein